MVCTAPTWLVQVHTDAAITAESEHGEGSLGSPHTFPGVPWPVCSSCWEIPPAARTGRSPGFASTATASSTPTSPGLDADLKGLTLLEAAAVGGETLPVDALANALGPAVTARRDAGSRGGRDERRRRQRGVAPARRPRRGRRDASAVARPGRPRLRSRVLLAECGDRGARDVSRARAAARHARPARAVPPRSRDAVRPRLRTRRDAEPVHPLQRRLPLRRAARISPARRRRTPVDRALRADRRARRPAAARARGRPARRIRATCSRGSTRVTCATSGSRSETR